MDCHTPLDDSDDVWLSTPPARFAEERVKHAEFVHVLYVAWDVEFDVRLAHGSQPAEWVSGRETVSLERQTHGSGVASEVVERSVEVIVFDGLDLIEREAASTSYLFD